MDAPIDCKAIYNNNDGDVCAEVYLTDGRGRMASGEIEMTSGERIPFVMFFAYTSIEGFAAYYSRAEYTKKVLINRACIQRIFIDN